MRFSLGRNLYDLIGDYESLCSGKTKPAENLVDGMEQKLTYSKTRMYQNLLFPDVCGRVSDVPCFEHISYLGGNDGKVVDVTKRVDFYELFESHSGHEFFRCIREQLSRECYE